MTAKAPLFSKLSKIYSSSSPPSLKFILASQSPYRKSILKKMGIPFKAVPHLADEKKIRQRHAGTAHTLAKILAEEKAKSLQHLFPKQIIIASDQLVFYQNKILEKPKNKIKARAQLAFLSGKKHQIKTSLCVLWNKRKHHSIVSAQVQLRTLNKAEIEAYVNLDSPLDCAGSYKIESAGMFLIQSIQCPDPSAIEGLPISSLVKIFKKLELD